MIVLSVEYDRKVIDARLKSVGSSIATVEIFGSMKFLVISGKKNRFLHLVWLVYLIYGKESFKKVKDLM